MKWLNVESFVLVTNGEMVIWYDDLNTVCKYGLVVANFVPQDIINLRVGVNCFLDWISPREIVSKEISWDNHRENLYPRTTLGKLPGKNLYKEMSWVRVVLCNYEDTDLIILYVKGCVRYGMFIYMCIQYVLGDFPDMSRGRQVPWGTPPITYGYGIEPCRPEIERERCL